MAQEAEETRRQIREAKAEVDEARDVEECDPENDEEYLDNGNEMLQFQIIERFSNCHSLTMKRETSSR